MILPLKDDNPTRRAPVLTLSILLLNVGVFFYSIALGSIGFDVFTLRMGLIPFEVAHGVDAISPTPIPLYLTFLTSMFMHGGWMHLGGNMLYLWIFGNNVEDTLGRLRFLLFYVLCGVAAALGHILSDPDSTIPMVGASGAIAGILGAYLARFPGARVHVFVFLLFFIQIVRVPALLVLGIWFIIQLVNASADSGGVGRRGGLVCPRRRVYCRLRRDALAQPGIQDGPPGYLKTCIKIGHGKGPPESCRRPVSIVARMSSVSCPLNLPPLHLRNGFSRLGQGTEYPRECAFALPRSD